MRVQITIEEHTKQAAEIAARQMGYASLAALLQVLAFNLAKHATGNKQMQESSEPQAKDHSTIPLPARTTPPPRSLEPTIVQPATLPDPEQFTTWPDYLSRTIWRTDPEFYLFLIKIGQIN